MKYMCRKNQIKKNLNPYSINSELIMIKEKQDGLEINKKLKKKKD